MIVEGEKREKSYSSREIGNRSAGGGGGEEGGEKKEGDLKSLCRLGTSNRGSRKSSGLLA